MQKQTYPKNGGRTPAEIPEGVLTKTQIAARIGCCKRHLENLMARKAIPYHRLGHRVVFVWSDVLAATKVEAGAEGGHATNATTN